MTRRRRSFTLGSEEDPGVPQMDSEVPEDHPDAEFLRERKRGQFPPPRMGIDAESMRERVRSSLLKPQYNVFDMYHDEGAWQFLARHQLFERVTMAVIAMNAIWIWVDTDLNEAVALTNSRPVFQIAEHGFTAYFSFEWTVRFMSFRRKRDGFRDSWFIFDTTLVSMMVFETWVMTAVLLIKGSTGKGGGLGDASLLRMTRLLRLTRMARMVRLFKVMPELLILIKGIAAASRSVCVTLILLVLLLYTFAIALRQLTDETEVGRQYFATVLDAMYTLLIDGTFMDELGDVARSVGDDSLICGIIFWIFVLLSSLTVMNMLIGVLCEVVSAVTSTEKEAIMVSWVKERMKPLFDSLDETGDGMISKTEFLTILDKPEAVRMLGEVGIDVIFLLDQADTIFEEEDGLLEEQKELSPEKHLSFERLMTVILELRGTNMATVKHIVELRKHILSAITQTNRTIAERMSEVEARLPELPGDGSHSMHRIKSRCCLSMSKSRSFRKPPPDVADANTFEEGGFVEAVLSGNEENVRSGGKEGEDLDWDMPVEAPLKSGKQVMYLNMDSGQAGQAGSDDASAVKAFAGMPAVEQRSGLLSRCGTGLSEQDSPSRSRGGPRPVLDLHNGGMVPQPLSEPATSPAGRTVALDALVQRLERIALEALCQYHSESLKGMAKAIGEATRDAAQEAIAKHPASPSMPSQPPTTEAGSSPLPVWPPPPPNARRQVNGATFQDCGGQRPPLGGAPGPPPPVFSGPPLAPPPRQGSPTPPPPHPPVFSVPLAPRQQGGGPALADVAKRPQFGPRLQAGLQSQDETWREPPQF